MINSNRKGAKNYAKLILSLFGETRGGGLFFVYCYDDGGEKGKCAHRTMEEG